VPHCAATRDLGTGQTACARQWVEPFNPSVKPVEGAECFGYVLHLHQLNRWSCGMAEGEAPGTLWSIEKAIDHVHRIEGYELEQELYRLVLRDETLQIAARPAAEEPRRYPSQHSVDGLLIALRDGYVRATGRRSTIRCNDCADGRNVWRLHATDPTLITTDEWRAGEFDADELVLTGPSWQYIHIQVPDFMVKAIWPDWPEGDAEPADPRLEAPSYSTPYLELDAGGDPAFRADGPSPGEERGSLGLVQDAADRRRTGLQEPRRRYGHTDPLAFRATWRGEAGARP
jgi:hypothetical protein